MATVRIPKMAIMYAKAQFLACALLQVNDELEGTTEYRHNLKFHLKGLTTEIEKKLEGLNEFHRIDPENSLNAASAIEDIAYMVSQMTMNDWLHTRQWMIDYLAQPDDVRMKNQATKFMKPITHKAKDLEYTKDDQPNEYIEENEKL
jgi:hypothetical protein